MNEMGLRSFGFLSLLLLIVFLPAWLALSFAWACFLVSLSLLATLAWHLAQLQRLMRWLQNSLDAPLPEGFGLWAIVFADLQRRVRMRVSQQQLLEQTIERFTRAAQALPDGIIIFNRHEQIEWMNAQAESHFQMTAQTDRGQALTNLIRQPDFVHYLAAKEYAEPLLYRGGRVAGQTLLLQVIPYGNEQTLLLSRDMSHLERLETVRRDFVANVSHELKTPLTVVLGFAEMLDDPEMTCAEAERKRYLGLIRAQTLRMQNLIEDLLTLSALETGRAVPNENCVDLAPIMHSVLAEAEALSAGRHVLSLNVQGKTLILGEAHELRSAFANLASNAVRYTPAGGKIELAWQVAADGARFSVTDSGIGIDAQHLPRLTERFYRVDRSRSRGTGGTGLGLAIVKHVLTRHEGALSVNSEPGKGSCFSAYFPVSRLCEGLALSAAPSEETEPTMAADALA
ncbi:MAG: phosphate regulon sensor histidine kinase PhoR [Pseudomonadota bacterium]